MTRTLKIALTLVMFLGITSQLRSEDVEAYYKPPLVPISISVNQDGKISVRFDASIVTPMGTFGIGVGRKRDPKPHHTDVVIRVLSTGKEYVYRIQDGDEPLLVAARNAQIRFDASRRQTTITVPHREAVTITVSRERGPKPAPTAVTPQVEAKIRVLEARYGSVDSIVDQLRSAEREVESIKREVSALREEQRQVYSRRTFAGSRQLNEWRVRQWRLRSKLVEAERRRWALQKDY